MNLGTRGWARSVQNLLARFIVSNPNQARPILEIVPVETAGSSIDIALSPKGDGGFSLVTADGTLQGGNKRGAGAVDLQLYPPSQIVRGAVTQVASGAASFAAGANNTSSGSLSVSFGGSNLAQQSYAIALGGGNAALSTNTVAIGNTNTANAANAHSYGDNNTSSGSQSIAIGNSNTSNSTASIAIGSRCQATADYSVVLGWDGTTRGIIGYHVYGASQNGYNNVGFCQSGLLLHTITTADATPTRLTSNNGGASTNNQIILPNTSAYYFRGYAIASNSGSTVSKGWNIEGVIRRGANAASTAIVGAATVTSSFADAGASTWTLAVAADTANGGLAITATGQAATTIRWNCEIRTTEIVI